jgi:hypothetical protein
LISCAGIGYLGESRTGKISHDVFPEVSLNLHEQREKCESKILMALLPLQLRKPIRQDIVKKVLDQCLSMRGWHQFEVVLRQASFFAPVDNSAGKRSWEPPAGR